MWVLEDKKDCEGNKMETSMEIRFSFSILAEERSDHIKTFAL